LSQKTPQCSLLDVRRRLRGVSGNEDWGADLVGVDGASGSGIVTLRKTEYEEIGNFSCINNSYVSYKLRYVTFTVTLTPES
jgi:hypothetical protein